MPDFPAHASPAMAPLTTPSTTATDPAAEPQPPVSELKLPANNHDAPPSSAPSPPPLISPAFTPPSDSPFVPARPDRQPRAIPVETNDPALESTPPHLLPELPTVHCEVRARIPTTTGTEMWLHLYHNSADSKEHLAIVFGPHIRSASLDAVRPGETERDRMVRGAYVGTLYPGRTSSRVHQLRKESGVPTPRPSAGALSQLNGPGQGQGSSPPGSPKSSRSGGGEDGGSDAGSTTSWAEPLDAPLVRIHSECYTGETVWSARCDCGEQLDEAARLMSLPAPTPAGTPISELAETHAHAVDTSRLPSSGGVIVYLRQEGRGIGLLSKLKAYNLQDLGHDTMEANLLLRHPGDARSYGLATAMLLDLGLGGERGIKLLTNNPEKVRAVEGAGREVQVKERVPMIPLAWKTGGREGVQGAEVEKYISTKIEKFKHMFSS